MFRSDRKKDRFDRALLVEYLAALGIRVDDPAFFGEAVAIMQNASRTVRRERAADFRAENNW